MIKKVNLLSEVTRKKYSERKKFLKKLIKLNTVYLTKKSFKFK